MKPTSSRVGTMPAFCFAIAMAATTSIFGIFDHAQAATIPNASSAFDVTDPFIRLSITQRRELPDSTIVKLKNGKVTTLRALRANHTAILANLNASRKPFSLQPIPLNGASRSGGTLVEKPSYENSALTASGAHINRPIPAPSAAGFPFPADYVNACSGATICLYYPKNIDWSTDLYAQVDGGPNLAIVDDPLADQAQCSEGGGVNRGELDYTSASLKTVCEYAYPLTQTVSVNPALVPNLQGVCTNPTPFSVNVTSTSIFVDGHAASGFGSPGDSPGANPAQCYMIVTMVAATPAPTPVPTQRPTGTIQVNH